MKVLVIDVGGTRVKMLAKGRRSKVSFDSGPHLTPRQMVREVNLGARGLQRLARKDWEQHVNTVVELFRDALLPDYVALGGGNARWLRHMPPKSRRGDNSDAFSGGYRLWRPARRTMIARGEP